MHSRTKTIISFVILVSLIFGLYFFTDWFSKVTGYIGGESEVTKLAQCLDNLETELYGGKYCPDCEKQLTLFGTSIRFLNYIECETSTQKEITDPKCKNLRDIPAWYINKSIHYGYKNISQLQELSGCEETQLEDFQ
jgi:hypothetical protein